MATFAQFATNRANAKSVVLPNEDLAEYQALSRDYHQSIRPRTPEEVFQVETMLRSDWQKRRLELVEADLYRTVLSESPGATLAAALLSDSPAAKLLARIQRQLTAFERAWFRAHTQLHRNREKAADSEPAPSPQLASFPQPDSSPDRSAGLPACLGERSSASMLSSKAGLRPAALNVSKSYPRK